VWGLLGFLGEAQCLASCRAYVDIKMFRLPAEIRGVAIFILDILCFGVVFVVEPAMNSELRYYLGWVLTIAGCMWFRGLFVEYRFTAAEERHMGKV
jgi:hypothetical protein